MPASAALRGFQVVVLLCCAAYALLLLSPDLQSRACRRQDRWLPATLVPEVHAPRISCPQSHPNRTPVLFLIHSAVAHVERRRIIRTYAQARNVSVLFVVGQSRDATTGNLTTEIESFADVILGDFMDSYSNLTLKHLFGLSWVHAYCSTLDFLVKADDDILIHFDEVIKLVDRKYPAAQEPFTSRTSAKVIACYVFQGFKVIRESESKWCVTRNEFPDPVFPHFCSGWGYISTPETVAAVLRQLQLVSSLFWIDDVFVTGILRERAGDVFLDAINAEYEAESAALEEWLATGHGSRWDKLFTQTSSPKQQELAYSRLLQQKDSQPLYSLRHPGSRTGRPQVSVIHMSSRS